MDVGAYTNVVLRLTDPENYCWKVDEEETHAEWTFTFEIVRAGNGWSRMPDIDSWAYGETPSVPSMGTPCYSGVSFLPWFCFLPGNYTGNAVSL